MDCVGIKSEKRLKNASETMQTQKGHFKGVWETTLGKGVQAWLEGRQRQVEEADLDPAGRGVAGWSIPGRLS